MYAFIIAFYSSNWFLMLTIECKTNFFCPSLSTGLVDQLQPNVGRLPFPARQALRRLLRHRRQSDPMWKAQRHLQVLVTVEVEKRSASHHKKKSVLSIHHYLQVQRFGWFLCSDGPIDGTDSVSSEKDEGIWGEVLPLKRRARMHQRLLLVCPRKAQAQKIPTGLYQRLAHGAWKGNKTELSIMAYIDAAHIRIFIYILFSTGNCTIKGTYDDLRNHNDQLSAPWGVSKLLPKYHLEPSHPRVRY